MSASQHARRLLALADGRATARLSELQDILIEKHQNAPRGGSSFNAFGQPRSAPGEPPAVEYGDLLDAILTELKPATRGEAGSVVANRVGLEYGRPPVEPRPLARMAVDELRERVRV